MNTLKVTNRLIKKRNCFTYGQMRPVKQAVADPTVTVVTTVTHVYPRR